MYQLPSLPYEAGALAPVIGIETMRTHHAKHHARYVSVTNELVGGAAATRPLEDVIADARVRGDRKLFNNAAQAWNHAFYWLSMAPVATTPSGPLHRAIEAAFGNVTALKEKFVAAGAAQFGSGWVWLIATDGAVEIRASHDAEQPWLDAGRGLPLLVCDVWEHSYYLDYKNERDRFLGAWFDRLANWDFAAAQFESAAASGGRAYRYPVPA
jgi:superoxide dismutase, Fe-Mn family